VDVDGNEYIDLHHGSRALLLGHAHPTLVQAVTERVALGTHFGACHEAGVQWGRGSSRWSPPRSGSGSLLGNRGPR